MISLQLTCNAAAIVAWHGVGLPGTLELPDWSRRRFTGLLATAPWQPCWCRMIVDELTLPTTVLRDPALSMKNVSIA